jgi:hypothetical protein
MVKVSAIYMEICIFIKILVMGAIIIKADKESNKILSALAKKLGGNVINLPDEQYEDFVLGSVMDSIKTGKTVGRESIILKLKDK